MAEARRLLAVTAALLLSLVAPTALSGQPCEGEWPTFQGDNRRSGVCGTVEGPGTGKVLWSAIASGNGIDTTPAVVDGVVYFGDSDGYLYAVDARTGALKWRTANVSGTISSPVVADGAVFIGSEHGTVSALDAASGRVLWQYRSQSDVITSTPAVAGGVVYVGGQDNRLYALDAGSGRERWVFEPDTSRKRAILSPLLIGSVVVGPSTDMRIYALDAASGDLRWSFKANHRRWDDPFLSTAATDGERLIAVTDHGAVWALNVEAGDVLWNASIRGPIDAAPSVGDGAVFIPTIRGMIVALDTSDGSILWQTLFDREGFATSAALAGPVLFASGGFGTVYALNASTGGILWKQHAAGGSSSSPVVADGMLYVGSEGFGASALDALDAGVGGAPVEPNVTDARDPAARSEEGSKASSAGGTIVWLALWIVGLASLGLRTRR